MPTITIKVRNKRAEVVGSPIIVCGNSDYSISWDLDSEWTSLSNRVVRLEFFRNNRLRYEEITFEETTCGLPVINGVHEVSIILFAGEIHTDEPVRIPCIVTATQTAIPSPADGSDDTDPSGSGGGGSGGGGGGGGSGGGGGGSETGVFSLYGNLTLDDDTSGVTSSERYPFTDSQSLASARSWLEANCPAVLDCAAEIGNYSVMGGLAIRIWFGDEVHIIPDSSYKGIVAHTASASTGAALTSNGTNTFSMHCTTNHVIFAQWTGDSLIGFVIVCKDENGKIGTVTMRTAVSAQTDPYQVTVLCEGMSYDGQTSLSNHEGTMTVLANCPSFQSPASVFGNVYLCLNREYLTGENYIDHVKLNGSKKFIRVGRNILLTR